MYIFIIILILNLLEDEVIVISDSDSEVIKRPISKKKKSNPIYRVLLTSF